VAELKAMRADEMRAHLYKGGAIDGIWIVHDFEHGDFVVRGRSAAGTLFEDRALEVDTKQGAWVLADMLQAMSEKIVNYILGSHDASERYTVRSQSNVEVMRYTVPTCDHREAMRLHGQVRHTATPGTSARSSGDLMGRASRFEVDQCNEWPELQPGLRGVS